MEIPQMFMIWFDGWEKSPYLVKYCFTTWKNLHPNIPIYFLDTYSLFDWLPDEDTWVLYSSLTSQMSSDYIRLVLLKHYGGIYIDARVICQKPIYQWLPLVLNQETFFIYTNHITSRFIASWFIVSLYPNHPVVCHVYNEFYKRLQVPIQRYDYFLFHHTFADCIRDSSLWNTIPKISSEIAHLLQDREKRITMNKRDYIEKTKTAWMHKCDRFFLPYEDLVVKEILNRF